MEVTTSQTKNLHLTNQSILQSVMFDAKKQYEEVGSYKRHHMVNIRPFKANSAVHLEAQCPSLCRILRDDTVSKTILVREATSGELT